MKERENLHGPPTGYLAPKTQKQAGTRTHITTTLNMIGWFKPQVWIECDWLIELSDNRLPNNNLASELMENRSFLNQSLSRTLQFLWLTVILPICAYNAPSLSTAID